MSVFLIGPVSAFWVVFLIVVLCLVAVKWIDEYGYVQKWVYRTIVNSIHRDNRELDDKLYGNLLLGWFILHPAKHYFFSWEGEWILLGAIGNRIRASASLSLGLYFQRFTEIKSRRIWTSGKISRKWNHSEDGPIPQGSKGIMSLRAVETTSDPRIHGFMIQMQS